jgi:hypothetical protein
MPASWTGISSAFACLVTVAPDSAYGVACRCDFVTVGMISPAPAFKDWRLSVIRIPVF